MLENFSALIKKIIQQAIQKLVKPKIFFIHLNFQQPLGGGVENCRNLEATQKNINARSAASWTGRLIG